MQKRGRFPQPLQELIEYLKTLPGIGPRTAKRLAFFIFNQDSEYINGFVNAILGIKNNVTRCSFCNIITTTDPCYICADHQRDSTKLLIVRNSIDAYTIEKTDYNGYYLIIDTIIDPQTGHLDVSQAKTTIKRMLKYLQDQAKTHTEVIFGLGISFEDEHLIAQLTQLIKELNLKYGVKFSRLGIGLQAGNELDSLDTFTIKEAIAGRRNINAE